MTKIYRTTLSEVKKLIGEQKSGVSTSEFIKDVNMMIEKYARNFWRLSERDLNLAYERLEQIFGREFTDYVMRKTGEPPEGKFE